MKTRFSTIDVFAVVNELQKYIGWYVQNIYDGDVKDGKTYLIKLTKQEEKTMILLESGIRLHSSEFNWPKPPEPSPFAMKLRKHLKNKRRLDAVIQLGIDRIVDLQFGTDEHAYHIIIEMYDRGNIILTDHHYTILNLLRWRRDKHDEDVKLGVGQKYPKERAHANIEPVARIDIYESLKAAKPDIPIRKALAPFGQFGSALLEHAALEVNFDINRKIGSLNLEGQDLDKIQSILNIAYETFILVKDKPLKEGYIVYRILKQETDTNEELHEYIDFQPLLLNQMKLKAEHNPYKTYVTFNAAVDAYYSEKEAQKLEVRAHQQEKQVLKKLENIEKDHEKRLSDLEKSQELAAYKAELIVLNADLVEKALIFVRAALAEGLTWDDINTLLKQAAAAGQQLGKRITKLDLKHSAFSIQLDNPHHDEYSHLPASMTCEINLEFNAHQNARLHHDSRRWAAQKEQKTIDASKKALKSAKIKTEEALKEVQVKTEIQKQRKVLWFEKFLWCVTQDSYLVLAGRDAQTNELLVKRYLKPGDIYVHTDLRGCASVVVKNKQGKEAASIPPRTLEAAATMAVVYSPCWENKVVVNAWWVAHDQVSRTAPSGEYLSTGSFMIRGKKNYLPPVQLVMGFGFMFRLDEESAERRKKLAAQKLEGEQQENALLEPECITPPTQSVPDKLDDNDEFDFPDVSATAIDNNAQLMDNIETTIIQVGPQLTQQEMKERARLRKAAKEKDRNKRKGKQDIQMQKPAEIKEGLKRGQKHRQKKIKEKYADQDEEEKELRMQILQGDKAITRAESVESMKKESDDNNYDEDAKSSQDDNSNADKMADQAESDILKKDDMDDDENDDVKIGSGTLQDLQVLDYLTGEPSCDDVLLHAVPVCAPYALMHDYKFKVKCTPGSNKRGKATKMAIQIFIKDAASTARERDLLKASLQQQDISRNVPTNVKFTAPQMQKIAQQVRKKK